MLYILVVPMNEMSMANMRQQQHDIKNGNATLDANALRGGGPMGGPASPSGPNSFSNQMENYQ